VLASSWRDWKWRQQFGQLFSGIFGADGEVCWQVAEPFFLLVAELLDEVPDKLVSFIVGQRPVIKCGRQIGFDLGPFRRWRV